MKKVLKNVLISSLITFIFYFVLYLLWVMLAAIVPNSTLRGILVALMTSIGYCICLLYIVKIRGEKDTEVKEDYGDSRYPGVFRDIGIVWKRESVYVYVICAICGISYLLSAINGLFFERAVISLPIILFFPMHILSGVFKIKIIGYAVSTAFISCGYLLAVLLYRKKQHKYWS